jgi:hypothetical protein
LKKLCTDFAFQKMTHFSTLRTEITDREIIKAALKDLGFTFKVDADVRGYHGQRVRADIVVVLEGEFDLGFSQDPDGSIVLIADLWGVAQKHNKTGLISSIYQKCMALEKIKNESDGNLQESTVAELDLLLENKSDKPSEIIITLDLPDDFLYENLESLIKEAVLRADITDRALGGSGLKVDAVEAQVKISVPRPVLR